MAAAALLSGVLVAQSGSGSGSGTGTGAGSGAGAMNGQNGTAQNSTTMTTKGKPAKATTAPTSNVVGTTSAPPAKTATAKTASPAKATPPHPGDVWVSEGSKVYHGSDSRYAGKTKSGKWMSEADAQKAGLKKAAN
jgi:hypothetical protein